MKDTKIPDFCFYVGSDKDKFQYVLAQFSVLGIEANKSWDGSGTYYGYKDGKPHCKAASWDTVVDNYLELKELMGDTKQPNITKIKKKEEPKIYGNWKFWVGMNHSLLRKIINKLKTQGYKDLTKVTAETVFIMVENDALYTNYRGNKGMYGFTKCLYPSVTDTYIKDLVLGESPTTSVRMDMEDFGSPQPSQRVPYTLSNGTYVMIAEDSRHFDLYGKDIDGRKKVGIVKNFDKLTGLYEVVFSGTSIYLQPKDLVVMTKSDINMLKDYSNTKDTLEFTKVEKKSNSKIEQDLVVFDTLEKEDKSKVYNDGLEFQSPIISKRKRKRRTGQNLTII